MDRAYLQKLIALIVEEVVRRAREQLRQEQHPEDLLLLLPEPVAYPASLRDYLTGRFGESFTPVCFSQQPELKLTGTLQAEDLGEQGLFRCLSRARRVMLVSPGMALLGQIAAGDDRDLTAKLMIRSILWQKEVHILLDYAPPRFQRNTFLASMADTIATLRQMQVQVEHYDTGQAAPQPRRELITEQDVRQAAQQKDKTIRCRVGAIITPSARDAIAETGVILDYS